MALPIEKLGTRYGDVTAPIDPERARAYAEATNDPNPVYRDGRFAPPVFGVVPTWAAIGAVVADVVPAEALMTVVHGEQDMWFHRPLVPGRVLVSHAEAHSVRVGTSGTRFAIRVLSEDGDGLPVLEQYVTLFFRGMTDGESAGPDTPEHDFPEEIRAEPVGEWSVHVDADQTYRYRDASGDQMPIHVDEAAARSAGLPGIIVHGLCTMAMAGQAVLRLTADDDPRRLARLAVRFAANVFPDSDVATTVYDASRAGDRHRYGFESTSRGATVIRNGWAEVALPD